MSVLTIDRTFFMFIFTFFIISSQEGLTAFFIRLTILKRAYSSNIATVNTDILKVSQTVLRTLTLALTYEISPLIFCLNNNFLLCNT